MITPSFFMAFVLLLFGADSPTATSVKVEPVEAYFAKAVSVEQLTDVVAVILTEADPVLKHGASIEVTSASKFVSVRATFAGKQVSVTKSQSGKYLFFGAGGTYQVTVIEFDPELGINFTDLEVKVKSGNGPQPPPVVDPPPTNPPPTTGYDGLKQLSTDAATKLNDPVTAKALSAAYAVAVAKMVPGMTTDQCKTLATNARFEVMAMRQGSSRLVAWDKWLAAIDPAVTAFAGVSADAYRGAILALSESLATIKPMAEPSTRVITLLSLPGCALCEQWKIQVAPTLRQMGWTIKEEQVVIGTAPRWKVCVGKTCLNIGEGEWLGVRRAQDIAQSFE